MAPQKCWVALNVQVRGLIEETAAVIDETIPAERPDERAVWAGIVTEVLATCDDAVRQEVQRFARHAGNCPVRAAP